MHGQLWDVSPDCYVLYKSLPDDQKGWSKKVLETTENFTKEVEWKMFKRCLIHLVLERTAITEGERLLCYPAGSEAIMAQAAKAQAERNEAEEVKAKAKEAEAKEEQTGGG